MKITVYCASRPGNDPAIMAEATAFGSLMAQRGHELVYGGSNVGTMGALSKSALAAGGRVTGIFPEGALTVERRAQGLTEMIVTPGMAERKQALMDAADAFVIYPGGFGTLEELGQTLSWMGMGLVPVRPVAIYNVNHFYDGLVAQFAAFGDEALVGESVMAHVFAESDAATLLTRLQREVDVMGDAHA